MRNGSEQSIESFILAMLELSHSGLRTDQIRSVLAREGNYLPLGDIARILRELSELNRIKFENHKWQSLAPVSSKTGKDAFSETGSNGLASDFRKTKEAPEISSEPQASYVRALEFSFRKLAIESQLENRKDSMDGMPSGWELFRRLAPYYKDCLRAEESPNMLVGVEKSGERFLALTTNGNWWPTVDEAVSISLKISDLPDGFLKSLSKRGEDETFVGYPVSVIPSKDGGALIQPVFTLSCSISAVSGELEVFIPPQLPDINAGWFERFFKDRSEGIKFLRWIGIPETGVDQDIDCGAVREFLEISEAASRYAAFVGKDTSSRIVPDSLSRTLNLSFSRPSTENNVILFLASLTRYTRGSTRELSKLANWSEDDLRNTGLATVVQDVSRHKPGRNSSVVTPVRLNEEQLNSVKAALESDITVITGPPGTGKSQAVASIMACAAIAGQSVLLASKNHKALDAIEERLNELTGERCILVRVSRPWGSGRSFDLKSAINAMLNRNASPHHRLHYENRISRLKDLDRQRWELYSKNQKLDSLKGLYAAKSDLISDLSVILGKDAANWAKDAGLSVHFKPPKKIFNTLSKIPFARHWVDGINRGRTLRRLQQLDIPWESIGLPYPQADTLELCLKNVATLENFCQINAELQDLYNQIQAVPDHEHALADVIALHEKITESARSLFRQLPDILDELSDHERMTLLDLRGSMSVLTNGDQADSENTQARSLWESSSAIVLKHMPLWAVTNLSASRIPFFPAIFDYLIIDEASACDIPSAIPLFARAKQIVIVGDPAQLQHVTKLSVTRERELLNKNHLLRHGIGRFTHRENSVFSLVSTVSQASRHLLREHYRCHEEIADYFNKTFYGNRLRVMTDSERLTIPPGEKAGLHWKNVTGPINAARSGCYSELEINAVTDYLKTLLVDRNFQGTVGVVTFFREQANRIMDKISEVVPSETIVGSNLGAFTAHQFQGDARDVIIMSLCVGRNTPSGSLAFIAQTANLLNVAVSRAKAVCNVIGDMEFARTSGIYHLEALVDAVEKGSRTNSTIKRFESVWEERLFDALLAKGLTPVPQHPVAGRRLDLALISDNVKIDIEVDGTACHRNADGSRKSDDLWRDHQISALGWIVKRFWVYQLKENMEACVNDIVSAVSER